MADPGEIRVAFAGGTAREGPPTVAQRNVLRSMRHQETDGHNFALSLVVPLPGGVRLAGVGEAVRRLVLRHESLRTSFTGDGRQCVAGDGELVVAVREDGSAHDVAALLTATRIDPSTPAPLRAAVVTVDGAPRHAVLALSHAAVDAASVEVLRHEFAALLRDPDAVLEPAAWHPVDQAAVEQTDRSRVRLAQALDYWRDTLARVPQCMFAVPPEPVGRAVYRAARLRSRALARAASVVAARTRTSRSAAVLAALSAIVGRYTGQPDCVVTAVAGNRLAPELRGYVGPLAQDALIAFPLGGASFDELVRRAFAASLRAYRHSRFDAVELWRVIEATGHARGTSFARDFVFNDLSGYAPGGSRSGADTEFAWLPAADLPARFVCYVNRLDGSDAELVLWADVRRITPARLELAARDVERVLLAAAAGGPDAGDPDPGGPAELSTVERGPDWRYLDSCWVDLAEVRRLVADALPAFHSGVFCDDGALVAFLAPELDPARAHEACMIVLPGRETAMAPQRYVICASSPEDASDHMAWRAQPVVAAGSGR